jgi:hypothetical protein
VNSPLVGTLRPEVDESSLTQPTYVPVHPLGTPAERTRIDAVREQRPASRMDRCDF